jgi:hypothetical protein
MTRAFHAPAEPTSWGVFPVDHFHHLCEAVAEGRLQRIGGEGPDLIAIRTRHSLVLNGIALRLGSLISPNPIRPWCSRAPMTIGRPIARGPTRFL